MSVADFLESVGKGAAAVGRAAVPVLERVAQVESGEAPQIDKEARAQSQQDEDNAIAVKSKVLENQLAMGQKYGTLTPEQQQQYVDGITSLYSHPRHAGTLMEKLRQAIHPKGAVYGQGADAALPNAVPQGGTLQADTDAANAKKGTHALPGVHPFKGPDGKYYQPMYDSTGKVVNEEVENYTPPAPKTGASKSPPISGNMLPPDATGPDGNPITQDARNAGHSFVQYEGQWWPVAKPKPVMKTIAGNVVLLDPQTGNTLRKLGPAGQAKVTRRQVLQPGDDGQMHLVTLTSITTPEGGQIDVDHDTQDPQQDQTAPKKGVGGILGGSKTPAKKVEPSTVGGAGPVVPGLSSLAHRKIETVQDRQVLESSKQVLSSVSDLMPLLEKIKDKNGLMDLAGQRAELLKYKAGLKPDGDWAKIFENSALLKVIGASMWSRIGRSKYTFDVIQQHLPDPADTPALEAIKNPQPDSGTSDDEFLKKFGK
jgi:hypothetical protein